MTKWSLFAMHASSFWGRSVDGLRVGYPIFSGLWPREPVIHCRQPSLITLFETPWVFLKFKAVHGLNRPYASFLGTCKSLKRFVYWCVRNLAWIPLVILKHVTIQSSLVCFQSEKYSSNTFGTIHKWHHPKFPIFWPPSRGFDKFFTVGAHSVYEC